MLKRVLLSVSAVQARRGCQTLWLARTSHFPAGGDTRAHTRGSAAGRRCFLSGLSTNHNPGPSCINNIDVAFDFETDASSLITLKNTQRLHRLDMQALRAHIAQCMQLLGVGAHPAPTSTTTAAVAVAVPQNSCCVQVWVCGEAKVRALNAEHRGKRAATDVLSFPSLFRTADQAPAVAAAAAAVTGAGAGAGAGVAGWGGGRVSALQKQTQTCTHTHTHAAAAVVFRKAALDFLPAPPHMGDIFLSPAAVQRMWSRRAVQQLHLDLERGVAARLLALNAHAHAEAEAELLQPRVHLLLVHALCHLVGHDHETAAQTAAMVQAEEEVCVGLGLPPLGPAAVVE